MTKIFKRIWRFVEELIDLTHALGGGEKKALKNEEDDEYLKCYINV